VQLRLKGHSSIKDLINKGLKTKGSFSSFEAGMLAGIVEKMTNTHCFAQELSSALETGNDYCEFMIVFQKD
jgi:predicted hydrocarbon binding protein